MNISEGNKIIAEFTHNEFLKTWIKANKNSEFDFRHFKYHSSWDWLIPAIIKFRNLGIFDNTFRSFVNEIDDSVIDSYDINYAFETLCKAIEWFNKAAK